MRIQLRATEMHQGGVKSEECGGVALRTIIGGPKIVVACREGLMLFELFELHRIFDKRE